jgi:hypothetical protein
MRVFALSDPHLSLATPGKEMDRFGAHWRRHAEQIETHWRNSVRADDLVLVPGDISWAMRLEQALADLEFLARLPGEKVLLKGNHDYWWGPISKLRSVLPASLTAIQGDAVRRGDVAIAGTRLWDDPDLSFSDLIDWDPSGPTISPPDEAGAQQTAKIFHRELGRLERALDQLERDAAIRAAPLKIVITHYPPIGPELEPSEASRRIAGHAVEHVVFGHLHAVKRDLDPAPFGERDGITYHLTSCDYLAFRPRLIAEI